MNGYGKKRYVWEERDGTVYVLFTLQQALFKYIQMFPSQFWDRVSPIIGVLSLSTFIPWYH